MKREEAIQILETQFPHDSVIREALATVIPEFQLRESEDERIRKFLITIVNNLSAPNFNEVERKNVLDWLEKQKEQKTIFNIKQFGLNDFEEELFLLLRGMKYLNISDEEIAFNVKNQIAPNLLELMQKEQKPISFSEPYNPDEYEVVIEGNATSLKRKEQKPVELNEEDDELRYYVYEAVQARYSDRELSKYLDPKIIGEKIELRRKIFAFLRNLGPSWKPTAEQMEALETAERWYSDNMGCNSALVSLCEQLRKLRYGCSG